MNIVDILSILHFHPYKYDSTQTRQALRPIIIIKYAFYSSIVQPSVCNAATRSVTISTIYKNMTVWKLLKLQWPLLRQVFRIWMDCVWVCVIDELNGKLNFSYSIGVEIWFKLNDPNCLFKMVCLLALWLKVAFKLLPFEI